MRHLDRSRFFDGWLLAATLAVGAVPIAAQAERNDPAKQPGELGKVAWWRSEAAAQKAAKDSGKPVLVLFQEVPG